MKTKRIRSAPTAVGSKPMKGGQTTSEGAQGAFTYPPELLRYIGFCLNKLTMVLKGRFEKKLEMFSISAQQFGLLSVLDHTGSLSQVDLGCMVNVDKASMVKLIDDLETKGYLVRSAQSGDRRVKKLVLTPQGATTLKKMYKIRFELEEDFLSPLSSKESATLRATLVKLLKSDGTYKFSKS